MCSKNIKNYKIICLVYVPTSSSTWWLLLRRLFLLGCILGWRLVFREINFSYFPEVSLLPTLFALRSSIVKLKLACGFLFCGINSATKLLLRNCQDEKYSSIGMYLKISWNCTYFQKKNYKYLECFMDYLDINILQSGIS